MCTNIAHAESVTWALHLWLCIREYLQISRRSQTVVLVPCLMMVCISAGQAVD